MPDNKSNEKRITFDVSYATFVRIIIILAALFLIYLLREIILILFLAVILAAAITPLIEWLSKKKIPRVAGIILIYAVMAGIIALAIGVLVPPMANQIAQLQSNLPQYFETLSKFFEKVQTPQIKEGILGGLQSSVETLGIQLSKAAGGLYQAVANIFTAILTTLIIIVLSIYFTLQKDALEKFVKSVTPFKYQAYVLSLLDRIQRKMGNWLRGQVALCLAIGVTCFIGLSILRVNYALALGAFAGITEIIPYLGPIIGAIPAVILAFTQAPWLGIAVIILYIVVQQLENHILVPNIMGKAVGLNPIVVILIVLVGGKLAGILGAVIAVPIATAVWIFVKDLMEEREKKGKFAFPGEKPKK